MCSSPFTWSFPGTVVTAILLSSIVAILLLRARPLNPMAIAAVLFVLGYALQTSLINPFIRRPEHSQFLLLVAPAMFLGRWISST